MPSPRVSWFALVPLCVVACGGPEQPIGTSGGGSGTGGASGSGTSGSATAGTGTAGTATAGTSTAGSGTAGTGTAGSGTAGSGTAGTGTAGKGSGGTDAQGGGAGSSASTCGGLTCSGDAGSCASCSTGPMGQCHALAQGCGGDPLCTLANNNLRNCGTDVTCADVLYNNLAYSAEIAAIQQCATCGECGASCNNQASYLCLQCRPHPAASAVELAGLSDTFDAGASLSSDWIASSGSAANTTVNVLGGAAHLTPTGTTPWFQGQEGSFFYKPVNGDFMVTSRVTVSMNMPHKYQMGGILVQSVTNPSEWTVVALGASGPTATADIVVGTEGKFSRGALTQYLTTDTPLSMDVRICVVGCTVSLLRKLPSDTTWIPVDGAPALGVQARAARPGLSTAAQLRVGMATWSTIAGQGGESVDVAYDEVTFAPPDATCD